MLTIPLRKRGPFRAFGIAFRNFVYHDCMTKASSISFVFLMAIIPFSALSIYLFNLIRDVFLPGLLPADMLDILVEDIHHFIPFVTIEWLHGHVIDSVGIGSFTTINFVLLPLISGLFFKTLEESYRKIFGLPRRHLLLGQAVYAFMSIFAILMFFMVNFVWSIVADTTLPLLHLVEQAPYVNDFYGSILARLHLPHVNWVSLIVLVLFFLATVKIFIGVRIKIWYRLCSGVLFGLLWLLARELFGFYIQHVSRINVLYGSLGSVCVVLLWTFYSAAALLFSVAFLHVLHCGPYKRWDFERR